MGQVGVLQVALQVLMTAAWQGILQPHIYGVASKCFRAATVPRTLAHAILMPCVQAPERVYHNCHLAPRSHGAPGAKATLPRVGVALLLTRPL